MHEQLSPRDQALEARLVELETRLSFQEQALNELSEALADARLTGARNAELIRHLLDDLARCAPRCLPMQRMNRRLRTTDCRLPPP